MRADMWGWSLGLAGLLLCCSASSRPVQDNQSADEPRLEMTKTFGNEPGQTIEMAFRRADADSPWTPVRRNQRPGVVFGPDRLWMPEQARQHLDEVRPYVTLRAFDPERSLEAWQRISLVNLNGGTVLAVLLWRGGYVGEVHLAGTTVLPAGDDSDHPDHDSPCAFYRQSCASGDTFGCQLWFATCGRLNGEPPAEAFEQVCQRLLRNCEASDLGSCVSHENYCEGADVSNPLEEAPIADVFSAIERAISASIRDK